MADKYASTSGRSRREVFYPLIDYASHPAFQGLDHCVFPNDEVVYEMVEGLDNATRRIARGGYSSPQEIGEAFKTDYVPLVEELRNTILSDLTSETGKNWLRFAFDDVQKELFDEALMRSNALRYSGKAEVNRVGVHEALKNDGMYIFHVDEDDRKKLLKAAEQEIRELRSRRHETDRIVATFARYSDVGILLDRIFKAQGIYDGLSTYKGGEVSFTGFSLEYSHSGQKWWKGCYSDIGLPDSRTAYMHYDYGCRYPKAVFALTDVREENGPTCFVRGSHKAQRSAFVHTFTKVLDECSLRVFGAPGPNQHYRYRFTQPRFRKTFIELPRAFQSCSHFGDDVLDGSDLSNRLLAKEVKLTSDVGHCIVFDGDYGVHRGANMLDGERLAFQIVFKVEPPPALVKEIYRRSRWLARKWIKQGFMHQSREA